MRTISQAVERVLERSPFLMEALSEGIANNAHIARKIQPEVEKILMEEVSSGAIAMAIHRLSKQLQKPMYGIHFLREISDIVVRSNLAEFIFENTPDSLHLLEAITQYALSKNTSFINFSCGLHESVLIVSSDIKEQALATLKSLKGLRIQKDLSAITMRLPEESLSVPGVYHPILKAIAFEGISIVEVVSVLTEFTIIVKDEDVDRVFSVLKQVMK